MNSVTAKFVLALLLATGLAGTALARPGGAWEARQEARAQRQQNGQGNQRQDSHRFDPQSQPAPAFVPQEEPRRGGRMTPEERRALRRQIDEAGRDLYAPRR